MVMETNIFNMLPQNFLSFLFSAPGKSKMLPAAFYTTTKHKSTSYVTIQLIKLAHIHFTIKCAKELTVT